MVRCRGDKILDSLRVDTPPRPDGSGVVLVINPSSASGTGARVIDDVRQALPKAEIVALGDADDIKATLRSAAGRAEVLAVGGGDGTVSCAAEAAVDAGVPLAVFPAGTFNHFAKDIGCDTIEANVEAIRTGSAAYVDLVCVNDDQLVINTASIGAYPYFVRIREKLEHRISKPLARLYVMFHTLRRGDPVRITYDNKTLQTSLFFLGNSTYLPSGFAPSKEVVAASPLEGWRDNPTLHLHRSGFHISEPAFAVLPGVVSGFDDTFLRRVIDECRRLGLEVWGHAGLWSYGGEVFPDLAARDLFGTNSNAERAVTQAWTAVGVN